MNKNNRARIVFLDAGSVNWDDISFKEIQSLGDLKCFDWTASKDIVKRACGADMIVTNKCRFDRDTLKRLPHLKAIYLTATGYNNIDTAAAKELGVAVANVAGYSSDSVAQWTWTFILALAGNFLSYERAAREGAWSRSKHFVLGAFPIQEISGKTLGIVGLGDIGGRVAKIAESFGVKVLRAKIPGRKYSITESKGRVDLERLLGHSDFVTLHTPLTDLTRNLINARNLRKMKKTAFLINMARGGIVNEMDLREALVKGQIAGAATDVLTVEPPPKNHVLMGAPNLIMTPHIAWASPEARKRLVREVALNIAAFQKGKKRNRVV